MQINWASPCLKDPKWRWKAQEHRQLLPEDQTTRPELWQDAGTLEREVQVLRKDAQEQHRMPDVQDQLLYSLPGISLLRGRIGWSHVLWQTECASHARGRLNRRRASQCPARSQNLKIFNQHLQKLVQTLLTQFNFEPSIKWNRNAFSILAWKLMK